MRKLILSSVIFGAFAVCFTLAANAGTITTIEMDGDMSDWDNVPALIDKEAPQPTLENSTSIGTTHYWDHDSLSWAEGVPAENACMYNDMRPLKVYTVKFANDTNYMYFYWKRKTDFMDYFWEDGETLSEAGFTGEPVEENEFGSVPPCLGDTIYNPADFNHDMVFSFDTNLDGLYDYYLVMNVIAPEGAPGEAYDYSVNSYIYQDSGSGIYEGRDNEILVEDLGDNYEQYPSSSGCPNGVCQEGRIAMSKFFDDLELSWNDTVQVQYDASSEVAWHTAANLYSFNRHNHLKFKLTNPANRKTVHNKKVRIKGTIKKGTRLTVLVNGSRKARFTTSTKSFDKKVRVKKGWNNIIVKAKKGSNKVVRARKVRRK
ncbi:MAG: hypothetical protein ABH835_02845 [Patescibacteria group bacterium]